MTSADTSQTLPIDSSLYGEAFAVVHSIFLVLCSPWTLAGHAISDSESVFLLCFGELVCIRMTSDTLQTLLNQSQYVWEALRTCVCAGLNLNIRKVLQSKDKAEASKSST